MEATTAVSIKAQDLRIGNWVQHPEPTIGMIKVVEVRWDGIRYHSGYIVQDWIKPIALTEEILEKAEFLKTFDGYSDGMYWISENADGTYSFWLNKEENYLRDLSYLHELQNLHFALTGFELEINL